MSKCWAKHLGDCGKQSREHVVSGALFTEASLNVQGLRPAAMGAARIGKSSLTANILCAPHNNMLSSLDSEAAALSRAVGRMEEGQTIAHQVDGKRLERWLLKTLINLLAAKWLDRWYVPAPELVEIAFGQSDFPGSSGLYLTQKGPFRSPKVDRFAVTPLLFGAEPAVIGGALMSIACIDFVLCMNSDGIQRLFEAAGESGLFGLDQASLIRRPQAAVLAMESEQGTVGELKLSFDW